jgi:outer membrane receptor protein involved in Fe transport
LVLTLVAPARSVGATGDAGVSPPPPDERASERVEKEIPLDTLFELPLEELAKVKVTTASGRPQAIPEAPATTYVITEEEIRLYGYRNLKDLLRNVPGIEYADPHTSLFGGQRGFAGHFNQTKLLVNGREFNLVWAGEMFYALQRIPLSGVKRVEIVQGPASVLYGADAFVGVINIVTKDSENSPASQELTGILGGGDKSSRSSSGTFHSVVRAGQFGLTVGGIVQGERGPDYTDFVRTSEFSQTDIALRNYLLDHDNPYRNDNRALQWNAELAYAPVERALVKAGVYYVRSENGPGIESPELSFTNLEYRMEQTHSYASAQYRLAALPLKTTVEYHNVIESTRALFQSRQDTGVNPPPIAAFTTEGTTLHSLTAQSDLDYSGVGNYLLVGVGFRNRDIGEPAFTGASASDTDAGQPVSQPGRYVNPPPGYFSNVRPFLKQEQVFAYLQDQQSLLGERLQITGGFRYDHHNIYGGVFDVRSGLVIHPWPDYTIRALYGQAFREPTIFELGENSGLKPARMNTWEVAAIGRPVQGLFAQVTYFQNYASQLIQQEHVTSGAGGPPMNIGKKDVAGLESLVRWEVGRLGSELWYSYEYDLDGKPFLGTASHKLGLGVFYGLGSHLTAALRGKYTNRARGRALDAGGNEMAISVPPYFTLDLNLLAGELSLGGFKFDLSLAVFNLMGRRNLYVNPSAPDPARFLAEGREFFGSVRVRTP